MAKKNNFIQPVLPLRDIVVFPNMIVRLFVGRDKSVRALEEVMKENKEIILASQIDATQDEPTEESINKIGVTANVAARLASDFQKACLNDIKKASELDKLLQPLHTSLFIESNPSPVKYAASLLGMCKPTVRLPLVEIREETKNKVSDALKVAKLL